MANTSGEDFGQELLLGFEKTKAFKASKIKLKTTVLSKLTPCEKDKRQPEPTAPIMKPHK